MAESTGTTRPRTRATTAKTPAKTPAKPRAAATKTTAAKAPAKPTPDVPERFTVDLEAAGETANFAKFAFPANMKTVAVGTVYAPLGTTGVKVLIVREDADAAPTEAVAE